MTRKQFLILVAALAALAAVGAWIMQSQRTAWGPADSRIGQRLVAGLKLEDVAEVALRDASATLTLVRRDGIWVVKERADFPADAERVRELLLKLAELKIVQAEPVAEAQRARLELAEPGAAAAAGTLLELKDGTGKTMTRLLLGKKVTARTAAAGPSPEQGVPTGRYVMPGTETRSVALVSDPLGAAEAKPDAWLSKDLFRAERVRSITASGPDGRERFSLSRETESYDWKLAGGGKPDLQKAQDVLSPLQGMSLSDVVPDPATAAAGLERPIVIRAQTLDSVTYTLRIGSKTADDRYFISTSVSGEPAAARAAGKGETAEEKEKQDKAFAENRARLLEKLEREKKLDRWTYLVARTAIEPLLRERAQLLPEKKSKDGKKP